jgi:hypothetical protein
MAPKTYAETTSGSSAGARFLPWFSRMAMLPPGFVLTMITFRFFTDPAHATPGVTLRTPEAFTDTRVIGAWTLTFLAMLVTFLVSRSRLWLGHLQLACFLGLTLAARVFGFMTDGTTLAMGNQRFITIMEIVFLTLNAVGLALQMRQRKRPVG